MGLNRIQVCIALLCASLMLFPPSGFAAITPDVSARQIRDYTRISFGWPESVRFKVSENGNNVTLTFNKKAENIDLSNIRNVLGARLINARVTPNGRSVQFTFDQAYRVRHFISGTTNGIDLIGTNKPVSSQTVSSPPPAANTAPTPIATPINPPQATPKPANKPASKPPAPVVVKAPAIPRTKPTPPVRQQAEVVPPKPAPPQIDTPAQAQPEPTPAPEPEPTVEPEAPIAQAPPEPEPEEIVEEVEQPSTPTTIIAQDSSPAEPEPSIDESFVAEDEPEETTPAEPEAAAEETTAQTSLEDEFAADSFVAEDEAEEATPVAEDTGEQSLEDSFAVAEDEETTEAEPEQIADDSFVAEDDIVEEEIAEDVAVEEVAEETPTEQVQNETPVEDVQEDVAETEAPAEEVVEATPDTDIIESEFLADTEMAAEEAPPVKKPLTPPPTKAENVSNDPGPPFIVTAKTLPNGMQIQFPWTERTGAAIFRRNDDIWIAFDRKRNVKVDILESVMPASVKGIQQVPHPTHTVLHMRTDGTLYPQTTKIRYSTEWRVLLSPYRKIPSQPVPIEPRPNTAIPNISLDVLEYSDPATVIDPVIGDELIVIPFYRGGQAIFPTRDFVDATILETSQGMAVIKKNDFVEVRPLRSGLRVSTNDGKGMILSQGMPALSLEELEALEGSFGTYIPYKKWQIEPGSFIKKRQELEAMQAGASAARITGIRHKLAGLYLGQGMAHEALALLNMIRETDMGYYYQNKLAAMRGAANFLMNRYAAAIADFSSKEVLSEDETKVWESALAIFQKDRPRFNFLESYETYIGKYPPRLIERLGILAADNYINRRSFQKALNTFDKLSANGISDATMPYINFLIGKISAENGNVDGARYSWEPLVEESEDRFIRARAQFALTSLLYNEGQIEIDEAIQRLDNLRIIWRGDNFELSLLNYLGQLYIDNGNYLDGLRTWRELVVNFPDAGVAVNVAREMARTFNLLFAEGLADEMEPLKALALFYEFRELTPIGEAGDLMIQNLATRLARVDLLDRAAALLEHQIKFRQDGIARSRLGAQLALVYILNNQPGKAINALELTGFGENPTPLRQKRFQLSAWAMAKLGEYQRAVEVLAADRSSAAEDLRLSIYWEMNDWPNVINTVERMLAARANLTAPFTDTEANKLLQLAIAYIFEKEQAQLLYLRESFLPLLDNTKVKDVFSFITKSATPIDPLKFEEVTGQIKVFEDFMQNYKDQIATEGLNAALKDMSFIKN